MLVFQFNKDDSRNVRLLDHEIPGYITDVIDEYNRVKNLYKHGIYSYHFIAQALIIDHIRVAIKQGRIDYNKVVIIVGTNQINFNVNAKMNSHVPKELCIHTNLMVELF